jgi:hypothetical protein
MTHPEDVQKGLDQMALLNSRMLPGFQIQERYLHPNGAVVWINMTIAPLKTDGASRPHHLCMVEDITERKVAETERERLVAELQQSLAEVKTLKGFIPICASCKKIRDDRGFWSQIEAYITRHSDAQFSHGICPECEKILYPG